MRDVHDAGGEGKIVEVDVRSTESVDAFADSLMSAWHRIDIAVANAGILREAAFDRMSDEQWHDMLNVDLHGVMRTARAGLRHIGEGGSLAAVSSIAGGVYGWEKHAHYATAKAGVHRAWSAASQSNRGRGNPGQCRHTRIDPDTAVHGPSQFALCRGAGTRAERDTRGGRVYTPEEVADVIAFLTSPPAPISLVNPSSSTARLPSRCATEMGRRMKPTTS